MELNRLLATPILWTPNMESSQWESEVQKMVERSRATNDMLAGKISFDDFCEVLNDSYIDVDACLDDWERGISYL
ncbi:MAG: hypothetical protein MUD14_10100 [Hydrococcus sp. Prado102]|jgi:hypothetical protein|nr:hypothetical protein [Hydrococcus sp. Prado102]